MKTLVLLRRFTIRARMLGAVAMVLGMFALVGAAGLIGGAQLKSLNAEMIHHSLGELRLISEMRTHLGAVRGHEKQMVIDYEDGIAVLKHRGSWHEKVIREFTIEPDAVHIGKPFKALTGVLGGPRSDDEDDDVLRI